MPEPANPKHRPIVPRPELPRGAGGSPWPYAELDVTSNFSFLRGASHPDELVYRAAELGYRAIAVTDVNSLAGIVRAHAAAKEVGIKLCVGSRLVFADGAEVLVWAESRAGYAHLCRLLTVGKRRAEKGECKLELADLLNEPGGLLAALVCGSIDPQTPQPPPPQAHGLRVFAGKLKDAFGNKLSIAISRVHGPLDNKIARQATELGREFAIPLLATNQVHYHDEHRQALQDVLTCIRHGCTIHEAGFRLFPNGERFLKPPEEMHRLFADGPGGAAAIRRTVEIAERCAFSLDELRYEYPDEIVPAGMTPATYLAELTWAGAAGRYPQGIPPKVRQQIVHELALIGELKIEPYFLTVYDLVRFARSRDILCQGRGSAANSAVCYCLGITSVDPDRIDVLFERFVSAARGEPPDIDVDFEHERREEVIQYLYEKYGRERAGMTAEVISYCGRSAVRDVGKAMGLGLDAVDALAKRLDGWHAGAPMEEQIREAGLDPADRAVGLTITLTRELLGFPRHLSQHVGGMVMTRGPLCELVPIENASMPGRTVIEWDKDDIDALGILKVDVLALGMLTAIAKAMKLINAQNLGPAGGWLAGSASDGGPSRQEIVVCHGGPPSLALPANSHSQYAAPLELHTIPPEDPGVYAMISDADTVGVFQIESRAQMSMLPRLKPREFYDLVIEVAIVRPGPIQGDMVHPYLRRRNGEEPVEFPKPELKAVLGKTLGVPLFQEQAMKVAMVAANFTAGEADQLRRAMAAWRHTGRIETFHEKMIAGMLANGYERDFAERCFNQIRGFGEYGFPESHAASFALLVYASAWIKRYHPAAFCCALLNSQPMGFYAPAQLVRDAREHGVEVRAVDVNYSDWDCTLEEAEEISEHSATPPRSGRIPGDEEGIRPLRGGVARGEKREAAPKKDWGHGGPAVRLGFRMVKGLAENYGRRIVERREAHGPFTSIEEFHAATDLPVSAVTKLSQADAFASLQTPRRVALWETLALPAQRPPLPLDIPPAPPAPARPPPALPPLPTMSPAQEIHADYRTTGLSLKGHPIELIRPELNLRGVLPAVDVWKRPAGRWVRVAGVVTVRQRPGTAKGIVFETIEDETGVTNLIIHPPVFDRYRNAARNASVVQADGYIERQGKVQHVMVVRLHDLSAMVADCALQSRDFH